MAGLTDGMGGEEVNQTVTTTSVISGTNVYAATAVTAGQVVCAGSVTEQNGVLKSNCVGSPSTFGQLVQGGSATIGAGSTVWVVFGTAFENTPKVVASYSDNVGGGAVTGSQANTGSVLLIGDTASKDVDWIAIG